MFSVISGMGEGLALAKIGINGQQKDGMAFSPEINVFEMRFKGLHAFFSRACRNKFEEMAPRESSMFNWFGVNQTQVTSTGQQQLFHAPMLPLWLATVLARQEICVAILCGAPCSGKSEAARKMLAIFGDMLTVFSDDLARDAAKAGKVAQISSGGGPTSHHLQGQPTLKAHPIDDFEVVMRTILGDKPRVVLYDDTNTQFSDYAPKLTTVLALGVKIQNLAWFLFDFGLPEAEEVEHLMSLQQV